MCDVHYVDLGVWPPRTIKKLPLTMVHSEGCFNLLPWK